MPAQEQHAEPPYRAIAAQLRTRIEKGELRPGDRMPSVRQIARRWGVAVATATKVSAGVRIGRATGRKTKTTQQKKE
ncbi:GntR family transcriptional regulator, partial [Nocardia testacea]|uniref:GntR family transcriptional regulator n=1 Tax=Nocardia testacea TaxID=248551 RepID=UPI0033F6A948